MGHALQMEGASTQPAEHIWHSGVWPGILQPDISGHVQSPIAIWGEKQEKIIAERCLCLKKKSVWVPAKTVFL